MVGLNVYIVNRKDMFLTIFICLSEMKNRNYKIANNNIKACYKKQ